MCLVRNVMLYEEEVNPQTVLILLLSISLINTYKECLEQEELKSNGMGKGGLGDTMISRVGDFIRSR
jgi:hypothetical protein